jgi:hypothetical protein
MTTFTISFISVLALVACKKSEDKPADTKTGETKVTDTKAESKAEPAPSSDGKCGAGMFYQATGNFCIKLPATKFVGSADGGPGKPNNNPKAKEFSWVGGDTGADFSIVVAVFPMSEYYADSIERVAQPPYEGKLGEQGKIGDAGAWASGDSGPPPAGKNQRRWIKSHNRDGKNQNQISCEVTRASGAGAPSEADVFEACKSIAFAK